jgi:hypothetical protein
LELTPNTCEYTHHKNTMSQDEIEVVKLIKKKQSDSKRRTLKKLRSMSEDDANCEISSSPETETTSTNNIGKTLSKRKVHAKQEIQAASQTVTNALTNATTSTSEHVTVISDTIPFHKPEVKESLMFHISDEDREMKSDPLKSEATSIDESETTRGVRELMKAEKASQPQMFKLYDDEDEFTDEIDDIIHELSSSAAEKYHGIMDETTFKQFLKLQQKQIHLAKNGNDNDEFEMVQSQLTNMMDEADEKEMLRKPINEIMDIAIQGTLENIDTFLHKQKILQRISELQTFTITTENTDEWMPTFLEITRLKAIPQQSKHRKKKKSKHRKQ